MALLSKSVSWSSIVELGTRLCDHCRGEEGKAFKEAFSLGQRCPQNNRSFGGREAAIKGEFARASSFAWLEAKQGIDSLEADLQGEIHSLRGDEYPYEELDQFLHSLCAYAEDDADYLMWQSATSGARIACYRKSRRSSTGKCLVHYWTAEFHDGHKPSWYAQLWADMRA